MKNLLPIIILLIGAVVIWFTLPKREQPAPGAAGVAFTENEDGELVAVDSDQEPVRAVNEDFATRDISAFNAMRRQAEEKGLSNEEWTRSFSLIERSGKPFKSEQLEGQPYVAGFFFSLCPTICLKQNQKVQQLQTKFSGEDIRFLSISCDPEIDTPAQLTKYARKFDADESQWLFLTGEMDHIKRVGGEMYSLAVERRGHAEKFVLVDAEGDIVGFYAWADPVQWQMLQSDIKDLLAVGGVFPNKTGS